MSPTHRQAAWECVRSLPGMPGTLAEAMRQPLAAAAIRMLAMGLDLGRWQPQLPPKRSAQAPAHAPRFDAKRAAAGDRDD